MIINKIVQVYKLVRIVILMLALALVIMLYCVRTRMRAMLLVCDYARTSIYTSLSNIIAIEIVVRTLSRFVGCTYTCTYSQTYYCTLTYACVNQIA